MIFINSVRDRAHLYFDGLVILCVIQVAGSSIVRSQYGDPAVDGLVFQWYGLLALYAAASWLAFTSSPAGRTRFLHSFVLFFGACVCGYLSQGFGLVSAATFPVAWCHWMMLGAGFLGRAYCRIIFDK